MTSRKIWLVYLRILVQIGFFIRLSDGSTCPWIVESSRESCGYRGIRKDDCQTDGCCWDEDAQDLQLKCYQKECRAGFFGWGCKFQCHCKDGDTCDKYTGRCRESCPTGKWGVGCMLDNECTYNDQTGDDYVGRKFTTENGYTCGNWSRQRAYPGKQFPDGNLQDAGNFCRNPKPVDYRTWCYYKFGSNRKWDYCSLWKCDCMQGRWGVNCEKECHCRDAEEECGQLTGTCSSGCDPAWRGRGCQECSQGFFGPLCQQKCHCRDAEEACDRDSGHCSSGCAAGWTGHDCQTECADGRFGFSCESECNCKEPGEVCQKSDGSCSSGCKTGFSGTGCQIDCHCLNPLEICNPTDGSCHSGCATGWVGSACNIEIPYLTKAPKEDSRSATSVTLRWRRWRKPRDGGDGPVTSYLIYYALAEEGKNAEWKSSKPTGLSGTVQGLKADTVYQFMIVPVHESGIVGRGSPPINVSTCGKPLAGPKGVALEEVASDSPIDEPHNIQLRVTWRNITTEESNCDKVTEFKVYMMASGESTFDFLGLETGLSRIIQNVDPFNNYTIGVSAINDAGLESHMSEAVYIGKAGPVQHLRIQPLTSTSLRIIWEPPLKSNSPVQFYILRYKEVRIGNCDVDAAQWHPMIDTDPDVFQQELLDLVPYTKYEVVVWAKTEAGEGEPAAETGLTEPTAPTGKVLNLNCAEKRARSAKFTWEPPECESRHGEFVGFKFEVRNKDNLGELVNHGVLNVTQVIIKDLVSYTTYVFQVWFVNHVADGPKSDAQVFTTLEDKPPAPADVTIAVRTDHSLTIRWSPPSPPNGVITDYQLKYWSKNIIAVPVVKDFEPQTLEFNLSELLPNTSYWVQIRAATKIGQGPWSNALYGFTDESLPDEPTNLNNVSRTTTSLTLHWDNPIKPNGILNDFHIMCSPMSPVGRFKSRGSEGKVSAKQHEYRVAGLQPGTAYVCTVKASTRKGYGPHTRKIFYTMPEDPLPPYVPVFDETKTTDNSVTIRLLPNDFEPTNTEVSDSVYQIVLETLSGTQAGMTKRSPAENTPCDLPPSELGSYSQARSTGQSCYITAEIANVDRETEFVVGDNKTYGGYYNAPLKKGQTYDVWVGLVVTVDGVTAAAYTKSDTPALATQYSGPKDDSMEVAMMAGAAVGIILALVLLVLVIVILVFRKRRSQSRPTVLEINDSDNFESSRMDTDRYCDKVIFSAERYSAPSIEEEQDVAETDPLYCNTGINLTRDPISVENLWNYVKEKKGSSMEGFKQEYDELPQGLVAKCEESRKPENKMKNRYGNIVAYDHSRIKLKHPEDDLQSDYINANYVDAYRRPNAYIATQGPSKYTLNDIWLLAWLENSTRIVMVTNLVEDGRHKCEQYWPDSDFKLYEDIKVELIDTEEFADYIIRTFTLTRNSDIKTVRQFHFTAWPDHGVPTYATSLLSFRKKVRSFDDPMTGPTIVHCSAGVGRTGTFIALDYLLDQAKVEEQVDIHSCVQQMRTKRVNMVQTQEQYVFVHDALLEALKSGDTSIPCVEFRQRYADLCSVNEETGKMKLQEEFELLKVMLPPASSSGCKDALDSENIEKNRNRDIVPIDNVSRPYLFTIVPGATDYINAVFVDGYKQRDAFIMTQHPLEVTIVDFWTMVHDHDIKTIIMMNEMEEPDKDCPQYFPLEAGQQSHGPFTVETISTDSSHSEITIRDFSLSYNKRGSETRFVRHFAYHGWPNGQCLPLSKSSIIVLLQLVEKWQQRSGNGGIVVHCMDGVSQSGLFCAVSYMVERLKVEQEVDVFQSVKHTRVNRAQLVPNLQQYQFLYDMAVEYMDCFETYANFK